MSAILAIDPGTTRSAWVYLDAVLEDLRIHDHGLEDNAEVLARLYAYGHPDTTVVIESVEGYGMPVGRDVFEAVWWSGRFAEAARPRTVVRVGRKSVKRYWCGTTAAKDANVITALMDHFGGRSAALGVKAAPGPLHGIRRDEWQALALGLAYRGGAR